MSKALWFLIAILLCSSLGAEALTCNKCRRFKIGFGCVTKKLSSSCTAKPDQKCKVVKSFLDGTIRGIITQGCTKSIEECGLTVFDKTVGPMKTICCDDRDFCNTAVNKVKE